MGAGCGNRDYPLGAGTVSRVRLPCDRRASPGLAGAPLDPSARRGCATPRDWTRLPGRRHGSDPPSAQPRTSPRILETGATSAGPRHDPIARVSGPGPHANQPKPRERRSHPTRARPTSDHLGTRNWRRILGHLHGLLPPRVPGGGELVVLRRILFLPAPTGGRKSLETRTVSESLTLRRRSTRSDPACPGT